MVGGSSSRAAPVGGSADHIHVQRTAVSFEYPVCFTRGVFRPGNTLLRDVVARPEPDRRHRAFVLVDAGVADSWPSLQTSIEAYFEEHGDRLELAAAPETLPGGEPVKCDPALLETLYRRMRELGIDRHSYVIVIGGGAVLDMVGYVAATTHRGVRLIRLPTTVLAQGDAGIGVKNGVNAFGAKNYIGAFAPPFAVLNDLDFLETLSERDAVAGIAEAIKVSLIADAAFFDWLESNAHDLALREPGASAYMVRRGAELHLDHLATSGDPFELGSARPLDFGHWAAHQLETLSEHRLRHGEAVSIGMVLDCRYSVETGRLSERALERICATLGRVGLPRWDALLRQVDDAGRYAVLAGLEEFREHLGGRLTVTLLDEIGSGTEVHEMDTATLLRCIEWMRSRWGSDEAVGRGA